MITRIVSTNAAGFKKIIPIDLLAHIEDPTWYLLGAYEEEKNKKMPAGVLVFSVDSLICESIDYSEIEEELSEQDKAELEESEVACSMLRWVYVVNKYRQRGHFTDLMNAYYDCIEQTTIDPLVCELPDNEELDLLKILLEEWNFIFEEYEKFRLEKPIGDILKNEKIRTLVKNYHNNNHIIPLEKLSNQTLSRLFDFIDEQNGRTGRVLDEEYVSNAKAYDMKLSYAYMGNGLNPLGVILVRELPSGIRKYVLLNSYEKGNANICIGLMSASIHRAYTEYPKDTVIRVDCLQEATAKLIAELLPKETTITCFRGICLGEEE